GERLVVEKDAGLAHDRPSQRHALPLAPRERARPALERAREAKSFGRVLDPARDLLRRDSAHLETEGDVAPHREAGVERVALKHHRHVARTGGEMRDVVVADEDLARGWLFEPGDAAQHGRLAARRWPEQHEELAVAHLERQVRDRLRTAGMVRLGETAERAGRQ